MEYYKNENQKYLERDLECFQEHYCVLIISNIRLAKSSQHQNFDGKTPAPINKGIVC